jgi:hypothetical protein
MSHLPAVRAVRALTRFHYAVGRRRKFTRPAARDRRASTSWGWHENVIGMGVSLKREAGQRKADALCVTFYVLRKEPKRRLLGRERIPERLEFESVDGAVLTDVVEVPGRLVAHAPHLRPVQPGAEVGHMRGGRGTLGPLVVQGAGNDPLALSCSHVLARSGRIDDFGKQIEQPVGDSAGDVVGTLIDFTVLKPKTLTTADVAIASLSVAAEPAIAGHQLVPASASAKQAKDFKVGTKTILFGAVTVGARGEVEAFESTFDIDEMPFVSGPIHFSGLVAYRGRCAKGDSGGLIMSGEPEEKSLVLGLHTAGRSDGKLGLFQPLGPIMTRFNLRLFRPDGSPGD